MFVKLKPFLSFSSPADGGGAPPAPAPSAPPSAGAPAPAPAPAAGGQDLAALVAEAVKSQIAPLNEKIAALETERATATAALAKAEAEKAGSAAKAATAEEQIASLRRKFGESQASNSLTQAADRYQYASPLHREQALTSFRAECQVRALESGDPIATIAGKDKAVPAAFDEWFAAKGSIYKAAAAQPGPGQPAPAAAEGAQPRKAFKDMTDEEFAAARAGGIRGTLTNDRGAPVIEVKTAPNPMLRKRHEMLALVSGRNGSAGGGKK